MLILYKKFTTAEEWILMDLLFLFESGDDCLTGCGQLTNNLFFFIGGEGEVVHQMLQVGFDIGSGKTTE